MTNKDLIAQATIELKKQYDSPSYDSTTPKLVRQLAYLLALYSDVDKLTNSEIKKTELESIKEHLCTRAELNTNDEMSIRSELSKTLVENNILIGTIIPTWNPVIPPLLAPASHANISIYDISMYSRFYSKTHEMLLLEIVPDASSTAPSIARFSYNTSCITLDKLDLIRSILKDNINVLIWDLISDNYKPNDMVEFSKLKDILTFIDKTPGFALSILIDTIENPIELNRVDKDIRASLTTHKDIIYIRIAEVLGLNALLVPKALEIYHVFNDIEGTSAVFNAVDQDAINLSLPEI